MKNNKFLTFLFGIKEYFIIAIIYIALASQKIGNLGLNYDELLFTNVALGERTKDFFITHRLDIFGTLIPLHNYFYIGILKSILYWPIFAIFGTSAFVVRFPVVILTTFSLFLVFKLLRSHFGKRMSLLITLITGLSTDLMFHTTYDVGPVAIEMFCKILLIVIMLGYLKEPKVWKILSFALVFFAGTFNKINFLWSGNSILAVFATVYLFNYLNLFKTLGKRRAVSHLLIFLGGVSLSYIYWRWCSHLYNWSTSLSIKSVLDNYPVRTYSVLSMTSGWNFFNWALDTRDPLRDYASLTSYVLAGIFGIFTLIFTFLGFLIVLFNHKFGQIRQFFALFYGFFWLTFVQQLATDSAGNPWHTFSSVFPFIPVCLGMSVWVFWTLVFGDKKAVSLDKFVENEETLSLQKGSQANPIVVKLTNSIQNLKKTKLFGNKISNFKLSNIAIALSFLLIFTYQISTYSIYYRSLDSEPKYSAFSLEFQKLSDYLKNQDKKVISTDWGPQTGLMTLDPVRQKYTDYWLGIGGDYNAQAFDGFAKDYLSNYQDYLVLAHGPERRIFRNTDNLEIFLYQKGFQLVKVKSFEGGRGIQYELFEIRKV